MSGLVGEVEEAARTRGKVVGGAADVPAATSVVTSRRAFMSAMILILLTFAVSHSNFG